MSPLPDVWQVTWKPPRDDVDSVDAHIIAVAHISWRKPLGGGDDASNPIFIERKSGSFIGGTRLDLDKGENFAAARDDIDFASRHAGSAGENPPAVQPEPERRERFSAAAALFSLLPLHFERSSARA